MRIEDIKKSNISVVSDKELLILKLRFCQLWDKNFKKNDIAVVGSLNRNRFLKKYSLLLDEISTRKIEKSTSDIDRALFKKAMIAKNYGIDVSDFEDIVLCPNYIYVTVSDIDANTVENILKSCKLSSDDSDTLTFTQTNEILSAYIPVYDLVLKARDRTEIIEVSKPFPNEHSARLQSPDKFDDESFRRTKGGILYGSKKIPINISIIWGKLKGKSKPTDPPIGQALRFPIKSWTVTKAKKWLSDNDINFISFESAKKVTKKIWSSQYITKLADKCFLYVVKSDEEEVKSKRYFPYRNSDCEIDFPHLESAEANILKSKLSKTIKEEVLTKAKKIISDTKEGKTFEKFISVYPIDKADSDEQVVCGIVYEPDEVDAQGDKANEIEIRKAAYQFMEQVQVFKIMHKGKKAKVKVLESYIAPVDFTMANQFIKKGSWVITVRILDKKIWKAVKDGKLTGFSMAGYAKTA